MTADGSLPSRRLIALLIGAWPERLKRAGAHEAGWVVVHHLGDRLPELRRALISTGPAWVVLGERIAEKDLRSLVRAIARFAPDAHIAVIGPAEDIERCECWLRLGALVYLTMPSSPADLFADLEFAMARDRLVVDAHFQRVLLRQQRALGLDTLDELSELTQRQLEVLELLCHGLRNAEIAAMLHIACATVDFHIRHILAKLGAKNRTEAADRARLLGLTRHLRKL